MVFTASMLTVLWLISLTNALAAGSARVMGHGVSKYLLFELYSKHLKFLHKYI